MRRKPTTQTASAGVGGSLALVTVWTLGQFGIDMPIEVGVAGATVVAFALSWLVDVAQDS